MDRFKCDDEVATVKYNQLSLLPDRKQTLIQDQISNKGIFCKVARVHTKQDIESIPDWSPIDKITAEW